MSLLFLVLRMKGYFSITPLCHYYQLLQQFTGKKQKRLLQEQKASWHRCPTASHFPHPRLYFLNTQLELFFLSLSA